MMLQLQILGIFLSMNQKIKHKSILNIKVKTTEKHYQLKKNILIQKIQLTITINFISSKDDNDEEHVMYSKSDNIEIMIKDEADDIMEELFKLLQNRYGSNLEELIEVTEFVFDYVHLLYYKCHEIQPNRGESYIDSPDWIKNKKTEHNRNETFYKQI